MKLTRSVPFAYALSAVLFLGVWYTLSLRTTPLFFPSPTLVLRAFRDMIADGSLWGHLRVSFLRILAGWSIGSAVGIPLGLLMGDFRFVRNVLNPYIQFFRFIPPIAFVTLSLIWFGMGETAKVVLIVYTTVFIVTVNTIAGVTSVNPLHQQAARCLGANRLRIFTRVILPSTIPFLLTGMRLAMGNSFMTIVSAEMIAADKGLGFLIFTSRLFMQTERIFVGIVALGILGFVVDALFRLSIQRFAKQYLFFFQEK
ncbi:MAG: ABC transporter permease [Deltaproteobacteria bacterium]|nr:ABC transporter permease [Deltaproteobacteria bacterium]